VVIGEVTLEEALQQVPDIPGLTVLGCGPVPPNPAELLSSRKCTEIFDALKERFDMVLVDSSPLLPVTDPVLLSRLTDTTLMIVAAGTTTKRQLRRGVEQLAQVGAQIGMVLNEVTRGGDDAYGYDYSYAYQATNKPSATASSNGHSDLWQSEKNQATRPEGRHATSD
jgi:polysaccharide biosynthesis transport protein